MAWDKENTISSFEKDFQSSWMKTIDSIPNKKLVMKKEEGKPNSVTKNHLVLREKLLGLGFQEISLPSLLTENDLMIQTKPITNLVIDNSFSLNKPKRPKIEGVDFLKLKEIAPSLNEKKQGELTSLFNDYNNKNISLQQLSDLLVSKIGFRMEQVIQTLELLFPSRTAHSFSTHFIPSNPLFLWANTLSALIKKEVFPIKIFSSGMIVTPELKQKNFFSGIIISEELGEHSAQEILSVLSENFSFERKSFSEPWFVPGTQTKIIFNEVEVGETGFLSPLLLSNFDVGSPTVYFNVFLDSFSSALSGTNNSGKELFPQFFGDWHLNDSEIKQLLRLKQRPLTQWGKEITSKIIKNIELYQSKKSPFEIKVFEKEINDFNLEVKLIPVGKTLCGSSSLDSVIVYDGNILVLSPSGAEKNALIKNARAKGLRVTCLSEAFAELVANSIEKSVGRNGFVEIKDFCSLEDVNLSFPSLLKNYVSSNDKKNLVSGELNCRVEYSWKPVWRHEQPSY